MGVDEIITASLSISENDDLQAFEKLFVHFSPRLLSFVTSFIKRRDWAEEVVNDVFIKMWQNRRMLPTIKNLTYYLYMAAKNEAINYLEKHKKHSAIDWDDLLQENYVFADTPEKKLLTKETLNEIEKAINILPPKCRIIFRLIKIDGLKYREVSEILNLSQKTVEAQMSLALCKITKQLSKQLSQYNIKSRKNVADVTNS